MSAPGYCPCCGEMVNGNTYEIVFFKAPALLSFAVCRACESVLRGDDRTTHDALVTAFTDRIEGGSDATVH